jgi:hypothetical protein
MDFDYTTEARNFDSASIRACNENLEPACGMDIMGRTHKPNVVCSNEGYDLYYGVYCKVQRIRDLEMQKEEYEWLPSMLEYFWQNGIGSKGIEFLKTTGFIRSYE